MLPESTAKSRRNVCPRGRIEDSLFVNELMMIEEIHVEQTFAGRKKRYRPQFSLRSLLLLIVFASLIGAALVSFVRAMQPRYDLQTETPTWRFLPIPDDAQAVSFYESGLLGPVMLCEFSVQENGFRAWATENNWHVNEIRSPRRIRRFSSYIPVPGFPDEADIHCGLFYQNTRGDSGLYVTYDRLQERAYYFNHSR